MTGLRARLEVRFASEERAARAEAALAADDDAFARTHREGATLVVEAEAATLRSLVRALDDVLATASVSEDLLRTRPFDGDSA